ncbi:outer dense fiber protein 2 isoform X1 [Latimeria chalumnae]|uniref:outer dense fiber protein 2 isoform X1 n=1 Tax=Latimeria chalumnae TaxID=7897 RepID=UPI0003C10359|nr:PREDICTED: outer dense fiber protein 2-like [Latimeria chalumnae]|eukprot:XP_006005599.1 PREDICTED: outer dense fiber protein 2-like [Latimeria chalumnae]
MQKNCSVIRSSDANCDKEIEFSEGQKKALWESSQEPRASDEIIKKHDAQLAELSRELLNTTQENISLQERFDQLQKEFKMSRLEQDGLAEGNNKLFNKLLEAEMAANSAGIQLTEFKDTIAELKNLSKQRANREIEDLLQKLTEIEVENVNMRREILEKEIRVQELEDLMQKEKDNAYTAVQLSKSVDATRAHLQGQLRSKEAENNRMVVQIQSLERSVNEQKLEIKHLKYQVSAAKEKNDQDKEALKKATRAQKQRADHFEDAVEKLHSEIKTKELKLSEQISSANAWKCHHDKAIEEKGALEAQIEILRKQVTSLGEELEKAKDSATNVNKDILEKLHAVNSENASIGLENARLKASISALEEKAMSSEAELEELKLKAQQQKELIDQYKTQVRDLHTEAEELKARFEKILKENKKVKGDKDIEVEKVKSQMEARLKELETFPDLLKAADKRLQECQESFLSYKKRYTNQSNTISELQVKGDKQNFLLESSVKLEQSFEDNRSQLQMKYEALNRKLEEVTSQNRKLVEKLAKQEESLHHNELQFKERSKECSALTRQLEAALVDVRKKVTEVKEKAASRERALQSKILEVETELSRKEKELKQLQYNKTDVEKQLEVRLKDLKLSLEKSETQNQSIQNYVQFLKTSYATMFRESL